MPTLKSPETIDQIERDILKELDMFFVIHMDPVEVNDLKILEKNEMIDNILKSWTPKYHFMILGLLMGIIILI